MDTPLYRLSDKFPSKYGELYDCTLDPMIAIKYHHLTSQCRELYDVYLRKTLEVTKDNGNTP